MFPKISVALDRVNRGEPGGAGSIRFVRTAR